MDKKQFIFNIIFAIFFILASILTYASVCTQYTNTLAFGQCIVYSDDNNKLCTAAEALNILVIITSAIIVSTFIVYFSKALKKQVFLKPIYATSVVIFLIKFIEWCLLTASMYAVSNNPVAFDGYWLLLGSCIGYGITFCMAVYGLSSKNFR
jgi:hypothetical protein